MEYNEKHGITPQTIIKDIRDVLEVTKVAESAEDYKVNEEIKKEENIPKLIEKYTEEMMEAAKNLQFERAAELRDIIQKLKKKQ